MLIRCKIKECNKSIKFKHNILTTIKGYNYSMKAIINTFRESRYSSTMVARTISLIIANSEIKSHNYISVNVAGYFVWSSYRNIFISYHHWIGVHTYSTCGETKERSCLRQQRCLSPLIVVCAHSIYTSIKHRLFIRLHMGPLRKCWSHSIQVKHGVAVKSWDWFLHPLRFRPLDGRLNRCSFEWMKFLLGSMMFAFFVINELDRPAIDIDPTLE